MVLAARVLGAYELLEAGSLVADWPAGHRAKKGSPKSCERLKPTDCGRCGLAG